MARLLCRHFSRSIVGNLWNEKRKDSSIEILIAFAMVTLVAAILIVYFDTAHKRIENIEMSAADQMTEVMPKSASAQPMNPDNPCGARCKDLRACCNNIPRQLRRFFFARLLLLVQWHQTDVGDALAREHGQRRKAVA